MTDDFSPTFAEEIQECLIRASNHSPEMCGNKWPEQCSVEMQHFAMKALRSLRDWQALERMGTA